MTNPHDLTWSLEFINDGATARKPIIRPLTTFGMYTVLRITDRVPALKGKMVLNMEEGAGRRAGVHMALRRQSPTVGTMWPAP